MMESTDDGFHLYQAQDKDGKEHSFLQALAVPSQMVSEESTGTNDVFNILMADVSGSMSSYWPPVVEGWQQYVKDKLNGDTKIFVFGSYVQLCRVGTHLEQGDYTSGGTDLTSAIRTVREEVDACSQEHVRVFIITDGQHGWGGPQPDTEINQMRPPAGKVVSVYLLGIGYGFPVEYSVNIRSRMHNGNANIPTLFWAKDTMDIVEELASIGKEVSSGLVTLTLNHEGYLLPGSNKTCKIHLGEWLYFEGPPKQLSSLAVELNGENKTSFDLTPEDISMSQLLEKVFRQWNSVLIQLHRKKEHVPHEAFDLMDSLFKKKFEDAEKMVGGDPKTIKGRLGRKRVMTYKIEYATLMNQSKTIIGLMGKFANEIELAENILQSTVTTRKYDTRNLKLKGHGLDDFETDMNTFKELYKKSKEQIQQLAQPTPEECCRVTLRSFVQDLQDADFPLMFDESKFDLLKNLCMTGIPAFAPVRDASQINPWTMVIRHILVAPFAVLSHQVIEEFADVDGKNLSEENKDVILQKDNEKSRFNIVIPILPAHAVDVLKPLIKSNLYAMMATFCILKNPHIIDHNAHIAALGCAWIRTIREFSINNRPEFIVERLQCIEATSNIYMERPGITRYLEALLNVPEQAIMTESKDLFQDHTLKCESLIKPLFFMFLRKDKFTKDQLVTNLQLIQREFIGRCLSDYKKDEAEATPFSDFFAAELKDPEKRKAWLEKNCKNILPPETNHLEQYFTLDDLRRSIKKFITEKMKSLSDKILGDVEIKVDMDKVCKLRNFGSCGDLMWPTLRSWAQEVGIPEEDTQLLFSPEQVLVYVSQALLFKNSKDRLSETLPTVEKALKLVGEKVTLENSRGLKNDLLKQAEESAVQSWKKLYMEAHKPLVQPMTKEQVVAAAQAKGIPVTMDNFSKTYRYNEKLKLVRNACQIPQCPHYLAPHNNFNQHISIEREEQNFPHALHIVSHEFGSNGVETVIKEVAGGGHAGTRDRRQPTAPDATSLQHMKGEIETLIQAYQKGQGRR